MDFNVVEDNLKRLPTEYIKIGDAGEKNSVVVARLMTDIKSPKIVNKKFSKNRNIFFSENNQLNLYNICLFN